MSEPRRTLGFTLAAQLKVEGELAAWRRRGARPRLWWRDDDARRPTAALDQLLTVAGGRPLALAVIPDGDLTALAQRLRGAPSVTVGQHGVDHTNRRPAGTPSEYAEPPSVHVLRARVLAGRAQMIAAGLDPRFYTPPWNAVDPGLAPALAAIGTPILSAGAVQVVHGDLVYASAEVDILSWKRRGAFKGRMRIMSALHHALVDRRRRGDLERPIGLLTHHLDHDDATWRFLEQAMGWFDARFAWVAIDDIPPPASPTRAEARARPAAPAAPQVAAMAQPLAV